MPQDTAVTAMTLDNSPKLSPLSTATSVSTVLSRCHVCNKALSYAVAFTWSC